MKRKIPEIVKRAGQSIMHRTKKLREKPAQRLFVCDRCEKYFLLDRFQDSCPSCGRKYFDQVKDLDSGEMLGGEIAFHEATKAEKTMYSLRREAARRKGKPTQSPIEAVLRSGQTDGEGNIAVVIMQMPEDP